jgi:hypothetical protein
MIDISQEQAIPLSRAGRLIPQIHAGKPVTATTLWRWYSLGIKARDGRRVKLEVIKVGGSTMTTLAALKRFFAELSRDPDDPHQATAPSPGSAHDAAERRCDAIGV